MKLGLGRLLLQASILAVIVPVALEQPAFVSAATASVDCAPQPTGGAASTTALVSYTAINPVRLVDTRNNIGGVDAQIEPGCTMRVSIGGDIPATARAVALSVTAVSAGADYFTVYPCASGRPDTSNLNSRAGVPTPNLVVAVPDTGRQICIYSHGRSHLIIDLGGWWSDGPDRFASIDPERVYDSRSFGNVRLQPFRVREVVIPSTTIASDATVAVINLTATRSTRGGYMVAFPCGKPAPPASNLNFVAGEDRAVGAIVGLGPGRTLCLMSDVDTDAVVDVTGYYGPAPSFGPTAALQPDSGRRVVDSRNGIGGPLQPFEAGEIRAFDPVAGLPSASDASAVSLNLISTRSSDNGYLTVYPCGGAVPEVSSLNFTAGQDATNLATVKLGSDRRVCVLASARTDVVVDVFGVMNAPPGSPLERLSFDKPTWPSFDPEATDYAIECGAGTGVANVSIDLELLPFTSVSVSVAGSAPVAVGSGTVTRQVRTDQPLVVSTTRQGVQRDYHLRCVPLDFPELSVDRPGSPAPGWYLTTFGAAGSPLPGYQVILDEFGAPVWYKRTTEPVIDFKRLSNGTLASVPLLGQAFGTDPAGGYWNTRLDGAFLGEIRTATPTALPTDHHDFVEIPGGGAMLSYPLVAPRNLDALNSTLSGQCGPLLPGTCPFSTSDRIVDGVVQEIVGGAARWEWRATDHIPDIASTFPNRFDVPVYGTPGVVDLHHFNGLQYIDDGTGDYLVTARHLDSAFRIDRASGAIAWTVGGRPFAAGNHLTIVGDPSGGPKRPHDARLDGDVLTMFDNRAGMNQASRAVAYRIDEVDRTATLLWQIPQAAGATGATLGSVRVADDGSVLVGWGAPIQPMFTEYDSNRKPVMSISQSPLGYSYRIVKYPAGDFDVDALRANAGGAPVGPP